MVASSWGREVTRFSRTTGFADLPEAKEWMATLIREHKGQHRRHRPDPLLHPCHALPENSLEGAPKLGDTRAHLKRVAGRPEEMECLPASSVRWILTMLCPAWRSRRSPRGSAWPDGAGEATDRVARPSARHRYTRPLRGVLGSAVNVHRAPHARRLGQPLLIAPLALLLAAVALADASPSHQPQRPALFAADRPAPDAGTGADRADSGDEALPVPPSGVRDPLLELLFTIAENDSLGTWDGAALARYAAASGRRSRLPVGDVVRIARRPATAVEAKQRGGARVTRVWELELTHALRLPLPWAFLGYHPGTVAAARTFVLTEWRLGDQTLQVDVDGRPATFDLTDVCVLRLDTGWFLLDVDAWIDALLGGLLDDYWVCGYVFGRHEGRPIEVSLLVKRDGKDDYGQFDLSLDCIVAHPEAVARGLSLLARPWVAPPPGSTRVPWRVETEEDAAP